MPKDNINDPNEDYLRAEVGWGDGYGVHLGVVNEKSEFSYPDSGLPFGGYRICLDRAGTNRLIRSLRKARDAAFGRDE